VTITDFGYHCLCSLASCSQQLLDNLVFQSIDVEVPDESYFRSASCSLNLISTFFQSLATGWWFSQGTPVSSTHKTDCHDITEILLKVALNTINQPKPSTFS
jgi:hypothetical protein